MEWSTEESRFAKAFYGRAARLQLVEWILERDDQSFFQSEAQAALQHLHGVAQSATRDELNLFTEWELLERFDADRKVFFTPRAHPAWDALESACVAVHRSEEVRGDRPAT